MIQYAEVESWMFESARPFWANAGLDRECGGFVEHLTLSAQDAKAPFKRTRVQARQIYVFHHAALQGVDDAIIAANEGWRFLSTHARRTDGAWVRAVSRQGEILDSTCDFYDQAFALFAIGWRARATADPSLTADALRTVDALDRCLGLGPGRGWRTAEDVTEELQQNPHMHLLEAAIELADATHHPRFFDLANTVVKLFQEKFFDEKTGALREFYNLNWSPLPGPRGRLVEPGHQFEWAWLLHRAAKLLSLPLQDYARALTKFAQTHGVDPETGLTWDGVRDDGVLVDGSARLWPQTEALKAQLAAFEHDGTDTRDEIGLITGNLLGRYLAVKPRGVWIDQLDPTGAPRIDKIPASTLYHLFLAFSELLRVRP